MATAAEEPGVKRANVIVTGFGPFRGVSDNPTQHLIEALREDQVAEGEGEVNSLLCHVLEVSAEGAKEAVEMLHCHTAGTAAAKKGVEEKEVAGEEGLLIYLHMGVDAEAKELKLECRAFNEADFRCPDERQHQPRSQPIQPSLSDTNHAYYSTLNLPALAEVLTEEGKEEGHATGGWGRVSLSHDAGRFVCNYTYYQSLHYCQGKQDRASLFLHVPPFSVIPFSAQLAFLKRLLTLLAQAAPNPAHADTLRALAPIINTPSSFPPPGPDGDDKDGEQQQQQQQQQQGEEEDEVQEEARAGGEGRDGESGGEGGGDEEAVIQGMVEMGFDRGQVSTALPYVSGTTPHPPSSPVFQEALILCLLSGGAPASSSSSSSSPSSVPSPFEAGEQYKMVLVVREDLGMSTGKVAAQCVHAALGAYRELSNTSTTSTGVQQRGRLLLSAWQSQGEPVVVLKGPNNLRSLQTLHAAASAQGLPTYLVRDAGRTEVMAGSATVLAIGPAPASLIDAHTGSLRLL